MTQWKLVKIWKENKRVCCCCNDLQAMDFIIRCNKKLHQCPEFYRRDLATSAGRDHNRQ